MKHALALLAAATLLVGGCGGGDRGTIKVSAAASLKDAFQRYTTSFDAAEASYSFAGSDELAAQIRQGVKPDVYAAANRKLPDELHARGLVAKPVEFATNTLVIAVPAGRTDVRSIGNLAVPGITIAAGAPTVPIGAYTREVLGRLPSAQARAIVRNIESNEPDVTGIVAKVATGVVEAGFVYATDVKASSGKLTALEIPARLQPTVVYGAAVVEGAAHLAEARRFVDGLRGAAGRRALADAGFGPPPR